MKTSQSQIVGCIRPTPGERDNMIHREAHILPLFRGMAILAQTACPLTNPLPHVPRYLMTRRQRLCSRLTVGLKEVTDDAIEKTQVIINLLVTIQFILFFDT